MADPSIDPSLARPIQGTSQQTHGVPSSDIFNTTYEGGPDPTTYALAAAAIQPSHALNATAQGTETGQVGKRGAKNKRTGPLIRKRSGWNAFYKEQFAIYHANNPPPTKQNARERKGFSSYAANLWKQLSSAQKEAYVQRAGEDDALAVSRPYEKLRRKRAGLLDTLGRIVAELETEFGVESLVFWSERDPPQVQFDGTPAAPTEGESFGIIGSTTGSRYIEPLTNVNLGPHQFTHFVQQNHPADGVSVGDQQLIGGSRKRKQSITDVGPELSTLSPEEIDPLKKKGKSNISRDYHDAEFRRLLLALLNNILPPQAQKTRLPRGFFGPYMEKHGLELVGLPEKPVEIGEGGKIGGWSADALRRNLEAVRAGRVVLKKVDNTETIGGAEMAVINMEPVPVLEPAPEPQKSMGANEDQEAARILAEGAGSRRGRRGMVAK